MKNGMRCLACVLSAATLLQTVFGQSNGYLQTMTWFKEHSITINDPNPPPGYRKFRDCDSNVVYKKLNGDTVTYYTLNSVVLRPLRYMELTQSKPYFNVTVYPKSVQRDGSVVTASMAFYSFLFRNDSLFALDRSGSESSGSIHEMLTGMGASMQEQTSDSNQNPIESFLKVILQKEDEYAMKNIKALQGLFTGSHPPRFQLIFYKNMFRDSASRVLEKRPWISWENDTVLHININLEKEWKQDGAACYYLSVKDEDLYGTLDMFSNLILSSDGRLPDLENCQVNKKEVMKAVQLHKDSVARIKIDSLFNKTSRVNVKGRNSSKSGFWTPLANVEAFEKKGIIDKNGNLILPVKYDRIQIFTKELAGVVEGNKISFVNSKGKEVSEIKYDACSGFTKGLAAVAIKNKWGFVDSGGKLVISCIYDEASMFYKGWLVKLNGLVGVLDTNGMEILPIKYDLITSNSSHGSYVVRLDGKFGIIRQDGQELLPVKYDGVDEFREGMARAVKNGKLGFVDTTGKEVIPFIYEGGENFSGGWARVSLNGKWGFINKKGAIVQPVVFDEVDDFDEDGLAVAARNDLYGLINRKGDEVVPYRYESSFQFRGQFAIVSHGHEEGVIDRTGKEIVPIKFRSIQIGSEEDWILVELDDKFGFFNKKGALFIPPIYTNSSGNYVYHNGFSEGLVALEKNGKWGYLDLNGKVMLPFMYDEATNFSDGMAKVKMNGKWGYINRHGQEQIPLRYKDIKDFSSGFAPASIVEKWGIIDKSGKQVIPFIYEDINAFSEGLAAAKLHGKWGFIDESGKEIIPFMYDRADDFRDNNNGY